MIKGIEAKGDVLDKGELVFEKENWPNLEIFGQEIFIEETLIDENNLDKRGLPWKGGLQGESNHKLVSLWDMIRIKIHVLCNVLELLQQIEFGGDAHYRYIDSLGVPKLRCLTVEAINLIQDRFTKIQCEFGKLGFAGGILEHLQFILDNLDTITPERYHENVKSLRNLIKKELSKQSFLFMPQDDVKWYKNEDGFGVEVSNKFRDAKRDIKEAGSCYSTCLYTACIFHLMRVAEYGSRALAHERGVTIKNKPLEWAQWGSIIVEIEKKILPIETKAQAGPEKDAALQFYHGGLADLRAFKDIYRNPAMSSSLYL